MTTDRPADRPPDTPDADPLGPWMNGLAGRPGTGPDHGDGTRLRTALAPDARDAIRATWQDIETRARAADRSDAVSAQAGPAVLVSTTHPAVAANDPSARRWLGWAAALLLAVGLFALWSPPEDAGMRGAAPGATQGAHWLVDHPEQAAGALAAELRSLQAEVTVEGAGQSVVMTIRAQPGAVDAVNARLAALETGLDAGGRLRLLVAPRR